MWDPPYRFVDEQIKGPYSHWVHEHRFSATEDGRHTVMEDRVNYGIPMWPLGNTVLPWVDAEVSYIFKYRNNRISELFGKFSDTDS